MTAIIETVAEYVRGLGGDQITALVIFVVFVLVAKKVAQGVVSAILTVISILAVLYFITPDLYAPIVGWISSIFA